MIKSLFNRLISRALLAWAALSVAGWQASAAPASGDLAAYQQQTRQMLADLRESQRDNPRNSAIVAINSQASASDLGRSTAILSSQLTRNVNDAYARMYYGYGQLFLATAFLRDKNYFQAAEQSKRGFFYIDEAAEAQPQMWRLRFLRARVDAFVPAENGRCVIALKDLSWLRASQEVPVALQSMMVLMQARAQATCKHDQESAASYAALKTLGTDGASLANLSPQEIPLLTPTEINLVLQPALAAVGEKS